jgi:hypothetical membrane protein
MNSSPKKMAGVFFFIAAVQFILVLLVAEAGYPGYNITKNYVSDLGVGPSSLMFNLSAVLLGVLIIIGTYFLQRGFPIKLLSAFLIIAAIGSIGVGIFPEDKEPVHSIGAALIFLFGGLSTLYSSRLIKRPFSVISILLGVISLSASVFFAMNQYLGLGAGGMERLIVYPFLIWTIGFSGYLLISPDTS